MRHIEKPDFAVSDIVKCCTDSMHKTKEQLPLIEAYKAAIPELEQYDIVYKQAMEKGEVYKLTPHTRVTDAIGSKQMEALYSKQFVKNKMPRALYYDRIMAGARNHICPYCAERDVSTLDHFLPKAHFPKLAINALNLIPSCTDCNEEKQSTFFSKAEDVPLHPYYDDVQNTAWLFASFKSNNICSIVFYAKHDDPLLEKRLQTHMKYYKLAQLYQIKVAEECRAYQMMWNNILQSGWGKNALVELLKYSFASTYSNEINSWRTAFYRAMVEQIDLIIADGQISV